MSTMNDITDERLAELERLRRVFADSAPGSVGYRVICRDLFDDAPALIAELTRRRQADASVAARMTGELVGDDAEVDCG